MADQTFPVFTKFCAMVDAELEKDAAGRVRIKAPVSRKWDWMRAGGESPPKVPVADRPKKEMVVRDPRGHHGREMMPAARGMALEREVREGIKKRGPVVKGEGAVLKGVERAEKVGPTGVRGEMLEKGKAILAAKKVRPVAAPAGVVAPGMPGSPPVLLKAPAPVAPVAPPPAPAAAPVAPPPAAAPAAVPTTAPAPATVPAPTAGPAMTPGPAADAKVLKKPAPKRRVAPAPSPWPAFAAGGATALGGMALMTSSRKESSVNTQEILAKVAEALPDASPEDRAEAVAALSMEAGFNDFVDKLAAGAGCPKAMAKMKKKAEGQEKTASVVKEIDGRKVRFNGLTPEDVVAHLAEQWGRPEDLEKQAASRPATAKFAALLKEALVRPT